jgi:DNA-binding transcriptional ArsR family regulator
MARKSILEVTDPAVWKVMIAPVRAEILETLRMLAPCGIADVARQLDRPADSLYRHFEKLVATGVVVEKGSRCVGRRTERVYDLIADDFTGRFTMVNRSATNDAYLTTAKTILTMASRTFRDAAGAGVLTGPGLDKPCNTRAFFEHVWLDDADFAELNRLFASLNMFLSSKKTPNADTRLHLVAVLAAPIVRRRGAARREAIRPTALADGRRHPPRSRSSMRPPPR